MFTAESDGASDALDPFDGGSEVVAAPVIPTPAVAVGAAADEPDNSVWPWVAAGFAVAAAVAFVMGRSRSRRATT